MTYIKKIIFRKILLNFVNYFIYNEVLLALFLMKNISITLRVTRRIRDLLRLNRDNYCSNLFRCHMLLNTKRSRKSSASSKDKSSQFFYVLTFFK